MLSFVRIWRFVCSLLVVLSSACGEEHHAIAGFCVDPAAPPESLDYDEGEPLRLLVELDACALECEEAVDAHCEVEVDGTTVSVTGSVTIRQKRPDGCGTFCPEIVVACDVPPLPAGSFEFSSGVLSVTVEIPSQPEERYCAGTLVTG